MKLNQKNKLVSALVATLCMLLLADVVRAGELDDAVKQYGSGSYVLALKSLEHLNENAPSEKSHYYAGLCYQYGNQLAKAEEQFMWVYNKGKDATLRYYAWSALQSIEKYKSHRTVAGYGNIFDRDGGRHIVTKSGGITTINDEPPPPAKKTVVPEEEPGIAANHAPPAFYGGSGWQVTFGPRACGRH